MPLVSVGVPVLNGEKYLEQTLEALAAQTLDDIEILISDNASVDRTREIAEAFAARDARFVVLPHTPRLGFADNWNRTLAAASGEYFMWNASDDYARSGHLAACTAALSARADAVLAFSRVGRVDAAGKSLGPAEDEGLDFDVDPARRVGLFFRREAYQAIGYGGVFRTDALRRAGGMPKLFGGDNVLGLRLAVAGPWLQVPDELFVMRMHETQTSKMQGADPVAQVRMFQPERNPRIAFPQWELTARLHVEALAAKATAPTRCRISAAVFAHWTVKNWRLLTWDLKRNAVRLRGGAYGVDRWSDSVRAQHVTTRDSA
jgi:glycosyltransferase involved in cell wall biosynthesis